MALRLIPSGPRRKELSVVVVDLTVVGELSLPWDAKAEAALIESAGPGLLALTWLTEDACLRVHRRGGAKDTLEIGDTLSDIGVGSRLEVLPLDEQHGRAGDWAYIVSAFKTPPLAQPAAADATPAALTGARMLLPTTGLRTSTGGAGSCADMATPPVPRALQAATAGLPASAGRSPGQAKRAADGASADEASASAGASQPAAEQGDGPVSCKRQKLVGVSSAGVPVPAAADVDVAAGGADMADAAAEVATASGDGTGKQQGQLESPARHAMLYAETQLLDPFELAAASPAVGSKGPAVQAAGGAAVSPAGTAAVSGGASGGSDPSPGVQQRRRLSAALALPPTQALDLAGEFEEAEGELEQEQTADKEQGTAEERAVEGGTGLAGPTAVAEQPLAQDPLAEPLHIDAAQARQPAHDAARMPDSAAAPASFPDAGPRRNGRAAKPGAAAVAADTVGETVRKCGELLRETQAVLFDGEGGASSRLATPQRAQAWLKDLEAMRQRTEMRPVVIGVVGDTGAGKSSMLNALLGEEEVLPQNGMRACTACVVEVSYAPGSAYTAEIEFMTEEEWARQVEGLWHDLLDEGGEPQITRGDRNPDARSMHGAAQAVLESVLGKGLLRRRGLTLEALLEARSDATRHLGQTVRVCEHSGKAFRKQIGLYVDSNKRREDISTWPLVRVCRIRHNWPVLATGAMLVDLPGVRDANAARGRVAETYLKKCAAIWVAADITRAVDSKTAKDLLGDEFRRQMMMDGQFGAISFVCTKTDTIAVREVVDELGVEEICARTDTPVDDFNRLDDEIMARKDLESDLEQQYQRKLRAVKRALRKAGDCDGRLQVIREKIEERGGGFGLDEAMPDAAGPDAELVVSDSEDEAMGGDEGGSSEDEEMEGSESDGEADGDEEVSLNKAREEGRKEGRKRGAKKYKQWGVAQLREEKRVVLERLEEAQGARKAAELEKRWLRTRLDGVKRELQKLQVQMNSICSRARNGYSKEQLKRDFREGVEAVERGAGAGARALTAADLDLPVYCISARDAQKLEGRCRRDGPTAAFCRLDHTEVPALREHVHDIARKGRIHTARTLAASLSSFLVSTTLLLRDQSELDGELGVSVRAAFEARAAQLQQELESSLETWAAELDGLILGRGLSPRLESGASRAEAKAVATAVHWGAPPRDGGYYWGTYKATVKRGGDYTGGVRGEVSFNGDLAAPILDSIAVEWDNTFGARISAHLRAFCDLALGALRSALEGVKASLAGTGLDARRIDRLCSQALQEEGGRLQEGAEALMGLVGEQQRDLSRDVIKPTVKAHMSEAYQLCTAEVGPGQFERMRCAMREHVELQRHAMFKEASGQMQLKLREVVAALRGGVCHLAQQMLARLSHHFSVLWERPPSNEQQRAAAVGALTAIARRAGEVCHGAGAAPSPNMHTLLASPAVSQRSPPQLRPAAGCGEKDGKEKEEGSGELGSSEDDGSEEEEEQEEEEEEDEHGGWANERQRCRYLRKYGADDGDGSSDGEGSSNDGSASSDSEERTAAEARVETAAAAAEGGEAAAAAAEGGEAALCARADGEPLGAEGAAAVAQGEGEADVDVAGADLADARHDAAAGMDASDDEFASAAEPEGLDGEEGVDGPEEAAVTSGGDDCSEEGGSAEGNGAAEQGREAEGAEDVENAGQENAVAALSGKRSAGALPQGSLLQRAPLAQLAGARSAAAEPPSSSSGSRRRREARGRGRLPGSAGGEASTGGGGEVVDLLRPLGQVAIKPEPSLTSLDTDFVVDLTADSQLQSPC